MGGAARSPSNHLLAALAPRDYRRVERRLQAVQLRAGEVLFEPGAPFQHVYFPNDSLISLVAMSDGRNRVEVGLVGRDGVAGFSLALGIPEPALRAVVQARGTAMRMPAAGFVAELERCRSLRREVLRFVYVATAVAARIAACNAAHHVEARLARRLLMTRDRLSSNTFAITQDQLGQVIGARRPTVSRAAATLQAGRLITYRRGVIRILDAEALRMVSCECYDAMRQVAARADGRRRNEPKNDKRGRSAAT